MSFYFLKVTYPDGRPNRHPIRLPLPTPYSSSKFYPYSKAQVYPGGVRLYIHTYIYMVAKGNDKQTKPRDIIVQRRDFLF